MKATIVTSNGGDFLTSDHPVIWYDPEKHEQNPCPSKLSRSAEVTFPLDRHHCVVFSYMPLSPSAIVGEDIVRIVNAHTVKYALEQVYAFPALGAADKERHERYLTDTAPTRQALLSYFFDPAGAATNINALVRRLAGSEHAENESFWTRCLS